MYGHEFMMQASAVSASGFLGDVTAREAYEALCSSPSSQLVDVRTHAEWIFSGMPDLSEAGKQPIAISWKFYPQFERNTEFLAQLNKAVPDVSAPLYFLCKTGGRSHDAAMAAAGMGYQVCYNIADGFEGEADNRKQRGKLSGWKAADLPWNQA